MKFRSVKSFFITCLTLLTITLASRALAQVSIKLETNHRKYLQYETIFCRVTLRNYSGHSLIFGESKALQGELKFEIENQEGHVVPKRNIKMDPLLGLIIPSGASKQLVIPVSKYYKMTNRGKYRIRAFLKHARLPSMYQSDPVVITVANGVTIWNRLVGVPDVIKKDDNIKTRSYRIVSLYDGKFKYFYLVVEDKKMIYAVHRIAHEIGNILPQCEVDALSRLHVLLKISPKIFQYFLYDITGKKLQQEVYSKGDVAPILTRNPEDGMVVVSGGKLAKKDIDYQEKKIDIFK